ERLAGATGTPDRGRWSIAPRRTRTTAHRPHAAVRLVHGTARLLRKDPQDRLAVLGELGLADAVDLEEPGGRPGARRGDLAQRRVAEDDVGGQALLPGRRCAPGAQLLEDRGVFGSQVGGLSACGAGTAPGP